MGRERNECCSAGRANCALVTKEPNVTSDCFRRGKSVQEQQIRDLLIQFQSGKIDIAAAAKQLGAPAVADLGFAQVDLDRHRRCGYPEVIFCQGKTAIWVEGVVRRLIQEGQDCLATRINDEQAEYLKACFPDAQQDRLARTFWLPVAVPRSEKKGKVLIVTAGTSDLPVAQEALVTAKRPRYECGDDRRCRCGRNPPHSPPTRTSGGSRCHRSRRRNGRRLAERRRRTSRLPGYRRADQHWLRRGIRRRGALVDDAQCLLRKRCCRQHRQRLQSRLCGSNYCQASPLT